MVTESSFHPDNIGYILPVFEPAIPRVCLVCSCVIYVRILIHSQVVEGLIFKHEGNMYSNLNGLRSLTTHRNILKVIFLYKAKKAYYT